MPNTPTAEVTALLKQGVQDKVFPGAVWAIGGQSAVEATGAVGVLDPAEPSLPMQTDTVFDVASLTKIVAVWSSVGVLWEAGRLALDDRLDTHLPETVGYPLGEVTVHHLLTHTAGVPLRAQLKALYGTDPDAIRRGVLQEAAHRPAGEAVEYTDRAALILGYLIEAISSQPLDAFARRNVWDLLRMRATSFGLMPSSATWRCAPTEVDDATGDHLRGVAHDFSARLLGGVCGIAGVFSTAADLGNFATHLLAPANDTQFGAKWTSESLRIQTGDLEPARGLFWHPAPGTTPDDDVWVHYGFTGTGLWVSPKHDRWATLLTNKLYYTRDREPIAEVRNAFRTLAFSDAEQ